tara:strand:+ start:18950 stop:19672 length:723 start_codon:yes stop_codon:yes gene_type:complete
MTQNWKEIYSKKYYNGVSLDNFNDKYNANKLMRELNINVSEIYYVGDYNNLDKSLLYKQNYVIKPRSGHSSKNVFLVKNGIDQFTNKQVNIETFEKQFRNWNEEIIVEEILTNFDGKTVLDDYKCYVFNGEVKFILHKCFENGIYTKIWYNRNWEPVIPLKIIDKQGNFTEKPPYFKEMIHDVEKIGNAVFADCFVRIDFYITNDGPVFGEITPNPSNGYGYTKYGLKILDRMCKKYDLV